MAVLVKVFALFAVFFVVSALPFENLDDVQLPQLDEAATEDLANVNFMAQQPGTRQKRTLDLLTGLKSYSYPRKFFPALKSAKATLKPTIFAAI